MFPAPKGRNGRHYQRQHLSGVRVTFRQQLAAEFASRNRSYIAAVAATEFTLSPGQGCSLRAHAPGLNTGLW